MFERFTKSARTTVTGAVAHAERADAESVTEEHLLLALLDQHSGRASFAITSLGLADRRAAVEAELVTARRRGGLTRADADALADIGIDVAEIVARVEEVHGEGALDRGGGAGRGVVRSPAGRRMSWRRHCGSRWGAATASSARSTCCWRSPPAPVRSPTYSPPTVRRTSR